MRRWMTAGAALALAGALATVVLAGTVSGTPKNDSLRGTAKADTINGQAGNDKLYGLAGDDRLIGGPGNDLEVGGPGSDRYSCGPGKDTVKADAKDVAPGKDCELVTGLPTPAISIADASVVEGNVGTTTLSFAVTLSAASAKAVSVAFATADGTATSPGDYASAGGKVVFSPGQKSKNVSVGVVGDLIVEQDETLTVTLSSPVNATVADGSATGTIQNDDKAPHAGHYAGTTAQGKAFSFDVSSDGTSLSNLSTTLDFLDCDAPLAAFRGYPFSAAGPISIGSDRTINGPVSGGPPALIATGSIQGSFDASDKAAGTLNITLKANILGLSVNCRSGNLAWSAS